MGSRETAGEGIPSRKIRVMVVNETRMGANLAKDVLGRFPRCEVVVAAYQAQEALSEAIRTSPDAAIVSLNLEGEPFKGVHLSKKLTGILPKLKIVIIIDAADVHVIAEVFGSGARGIVRAGEPVKKLWECVSRVHAGEIYASPSDMALLVEAFAEGLSSRPASFNGAGRLTRSEHRVARYVAEGFTNREIAGKLGLSEHTIKNHLFRIFEKLSVASRAELILSMVSQRISPSVNEADYDGLAGLPDGSLFSRYRKAAEEGNPAAQIRLGELYDHGQGVPRDRVTAYMWFSIAEQCAGFLLESARQVRNQLAARRMRESEIATAQASVAPWLVRHAHLYPPRPLAAPKVDSGNGQPLQEPKVIAREELLAASWGNRAEANARPAVAGRAR